MSMLTEQQAKALLDKVLSFSQADEMSASLSGGRTGNIRYALNKVTTNGETENLSVSVTAVFGKRSGTATTNETDDAALERAVRQAEETARLAPENPEYVSVLEPQPYETGKTFSESTAAVDPLFRVEAVLASIQECEKTKTSAAGFLQDNAGFLAIANSKGLFGYNRNSGGEFSVTARSADEKGSGFGAQYFTDAKELDTKTATQTAVRKALATRETKELKPGKMTVVLEPQAVYDLLSLLVGAMDARTADEGRNFFGKRGAGNRIGDQLFNDKVTIYSDPLHPQNPQAPFAGDGRPQKKMTWIEKGVLKNLSYTRYWAKQKNVESIAAPGGVIVEGTEQTLNDLIKGSDKAVLVTRFWYIRMVDPQTLVHTGLTRDGTFYIENGTVKHAVKNFRFNESPATMLANVEAIGKPVRIANSLIPPMRIRDFNFTSLSDAV